MFIEKLIDGIIEKNNPSILGLDPDMSYIPEFIIKDAFGRHGKNLN